MFTKSMTLNLDELKEIRKALVFYAFNFDEVDKELKHKLLVLADKILYI